VIPSAQDHHYPCQEHGLCLIDQFQNDAAKNEASYAPQSVNLELCCTASGCKSLKEWLAED
jgi:hypothetical protein